MLCGIGVGEARFVEGDQAGPQHPESSSISFDEHYPLALLR
jgi:hypothetical protein